MFGQRAVATFMKKRKFTHLTLALAAVLVLGSCSTASQQHGLNDAGISDPFEEANRFVFAFNDAIDDAFIHPMVKGYQLVLPKPARTGVSNFLSNLRSPIHLANQLLQGDVGGAGTVVARTVVNTVVGIGGLIDVAKHIGLEHEPEDFGQTLAVWGVGHGPYLVVPIIGPASARDYAGFIVDSFADPLRWWLFNIDEEGWYYAKVGADYMDVRHSLIGVLEDLEKSSIDYYAAVRSTYYQRRMALVNDENPDAAVAPDIPDFDD